MSQLSEVILKALGETMYMVVIVSVATIVLGTLLGIVLVTTQKNNILSSPKINKVIGTIVNILRSFPTIILIIIALPLSRLIVGTTIGKEAAVIPITIGMIPFLSRVVESSLKEVDYGKIEAAIAMGANPIQIIFKVLIPEGLPSLIRGYTLSIISIIGCTALAGSIGARFPYHGSGAVTRCPSPLAWRPAFPGAPREAH